MQMASTLRTDEREKERKWARKREIERSGVNEREITGDAAVAVAAATAVAACACTRFFLRSSVPLASA